MYGVESKQMSCEKLPLHRSATQAIDITHNTVARFLINKDAHTRIHTYEMLDFMMYKPTYTHTRIQPHVIYKNKVYFIKKKVFVFFTSVLNYLRLVARFHAEIWI